MSDVKHAPDEKSFIEVKHAELEDLSKFKDAVFVFEPIARFVMQSLSFQDALSLMQSKPKYMVHPIDPFTGQLSLIWRLFLEFNWEVLLENNFLWKFKRQYKWNYSSVQTVYSKLRQLGRKHQETKSISVTPKHYFPENLASGEEISLYIYLLTTFFAHTFRADRITFHDRHNEFHQIFIRYVDDEKMWQYSIYDSIVDSPRDKVRFKRLGNTREERIAFAQHLFILMTNPDLHMIYIHFSDNLSLPEKQTLNRNLKDVIRNLRGSKYSIRFHNKPGMDQVIIKKG